MKDRIVSVNGVRPPEKREEIRRKRKYKEILAVHFHFQIPTAYKDHATGKWFPIEHEQVTRLFDRLTRRFRDYKGCEGLTYSNPFAPPPYEGRHKNDLPEQSYNVLWIVPAYLFTVVYPALMRIKGFLEKRFQQDNILFFYDFKMTTL